MLQGLILLLPLLSFLTCILLGRFIGYRGVFIISTASMFCLSVCSIYLFWEVSQSTSGKELVYLDLGTWLQVQELSIGYSFHFDFLASVMILVISLVSTCVHIFSYDYMKMDPHYNRFISYLSLFTFFMLILVSADNLIVMFFGWEGVGLCSYLLVGFWNTRPEASVSALKAFLYNRVGDIGLLLGFGLIYHYYRSFDYSIIASVTPFYVGKEIEIFGFKVKLLSLIGVLLLFGVTGKSAQIGLHAWLPDSMEGPTPVSALIHAATMVTAGIFLILRMSFFFEFIPLALNLMLFLGGITAFTAGIISFMQDDIKKIIAFSTCSQLGYIVFMCGLSQYDYALIHLVNHAFFKALLFLTSGVVIYVYSNQDLRKISGINVISVGITICFLLGVFSLEGFFYFSSIDSKDAILEMAGNRFVIKSNAIFYFTGFTIFLTSMYASNLIDRCTGEYEQNRRVLKKVPKIGYMLFVPLVILAVLTILSTMIFSKLITNPFLFKFFTHPEHEIINSVDALPFFFKLFIIIIPSATIIPKIRLYKIQNFFGKLEPTHGTWFKYVFLVFLQFFTFEFLRDISITDPEWVIPHIELFVMMTVFVVVTIILGPEKDIQIVVWYCGALLSLVTWKHSLVLWNGIYFIYIFYLLYMSGLFRVYGWFNMSASTYSYAVWVASSNWMNHWTSPAIAVVCFIAFMEIFPFDFLMFLGKLEKFSEWWVKIQINLYSLKVLNLKKQFDFLYNKIYYDFIVNEVFNSKFFAWSFWYNLVIEKGILEFFGPTGFCLLIFNMIKKIRSHFSGHKVNYICLFLFFLLWIFIIWSFLT